MISIQSLEKNRKGNLKRNTLSPVPYFDWGNLLCTFKAENSPRFFHPKWKRPRNRTGLATGCDWMLAQREGLWTFHNNYMMQQLCPPLWIAPPQRLWERDRFELSVCFSRGRSMHVLFLSFSLVGRPKLDLCDSLTFCAGEMARIPPNKPSKHRRNPEERATTIQVR